MYTYKVEQVIKAAAILHKDQVRKGETPFPYITHLFAVAMIVADYTEDEDVIVAALLHDTLEDTDYTEDELREDFGGKVRDIVAAVTEPAPKVGEERSWKTMKMGYVKQLRDAPENALLVSAADKIHNMRCIVEEFYDKHSEFVAHFSGKLDERLIMYQEISNILNRRLKNDIVYEFNNVFAEYKKFIEHVKKSIEQF